MAKKNEPKTDRSGNMIGDGSYHVNYHVLEFPEYPQILSNVSKSETTESVYVKYTNTENGDSITARFSWHENNAVKFGDQLNGYLASKEEILFRLGFLKRTFVPYMKKEVSTRQIKKSEKLNYEEIALTIQELYELPVGYDLSEFKNKLVKNSNRIIIGDKINEFVEGGHYKYVPLNFETREEKLKKEHDKELEIYQKIWYDYKELLIKNGFSIGRNHRTYQDIDVFKNENRKMILQVEVGGGAFSYIWLQKGALEFSEYPFILNYVKFLHKNEEKLFLLMDNSKPEINIGSLTEQFETMLREELKACGTGIFPKICSLRDSERGFELIFKNVFDISSKTGMSIGSALAQYESTL